MVRKQLCAYVVALLVLAVMPLPTSERGEVIVEPGERWVHPIDLDMPAHVTCIIRSDDAVGVFLCDGKGLEELKNGSYDLATHSAWDVTRDHWTEKLQGEEHYLVVMNAGNEEVEVQYQVHIDHVLVGNLTAKNIMVLSLALSMGLVALALFGRRRWP